MSVGLTAPPVLPPSGDLDRLKGPRAETMAAEKARLRKATKEFEALFLDQLLKTMRKTIPENAFADDAPLSGSSGKETFTELFDTEVARTMARGDRNSIGDILFKSLEKTIEAQYLQDDGRKPEIKPLEQPERSPIRLQPEPVDFPDQKAPIKPLDQDEIDRQIRVPIGDTADPQDGSGSSGVRELMPTVRPTQAQVPDATSVAQTVLPENEILTNYGDIIDEAARAHKLDSTLIASVIKVESNGNPEAVSDAGAKGLMQLVDSTAGDMGVGDVFDPKANVMGGSKYLRKLLDRYQDLKLALAAYNAGPGNVDRHGGVPPFKETQSYVRKVTKLYNESAEQISGKAF